MNSAAQQVSSLWGKVMKSIGHERRERKQSLEDRLYRLEALLLEHKTAEADYIDKIRKQFARVQEAKDSTQQKTLQAKDKIQERQGMLAQRVNQILSELKEQSRQSRVKLDSLYAQKKQLLQQTNFEQARVRADCEFEQFQRILKELRRIREDVRAQANDRKSNCRSLLRTIESQLGECYEAAEQQKTQSRSARQAVAWGCRQSEEGLRQQLRQEEAQRKKFGEGVLRVIEMAYDKAQ